MNNEELKREENLTEEVNENIEAAENAAESTEEKQEASQADTAPQESEENKKKKIFGKKEKETEYLIRIAELEGEVSKLKNDYLKAYADTENTRRRLNADFETRNKYRIQSFAVEILPALDNLERALAQPRTEANESYAKGVEMIYNQLMYALQKEGVEQVDPLNEEFDANFHQALMVEKVEGVEPNRVLQVLQKGYKLKDRILRPAMVKVSE